MDIFSLGSFDIDPEYQGNLASVRLDAPSDLAVELRHQRMVLRQRRLSGGSVRVLGADQPVRQIVRRVRLLRPVILDLDGDGVSIEPRTDSSVFFNADSDLAMERTVWVGAGDGMLAVDLDGDGKITKADEIAFANRPPPIRTTPTSRRRHAVRRQRRPQDRRQRSRLEPAARVDRLQPQRADRRGELHTLGQLGISSISLVSDRNTFTLSDGSRINGFGSFVRNGATHTLADAQLWDHKFRDDARL